MAQFDDALRKQIASLVRVLKVTACMRDDKVPCEIEQGLFLGSMVAADYKDGLKSRNVTHVLTVSNSLSPAHPNDFVYKVVAVADREDTNLSQYFDECIDFIDEAKRQGGGVLVHCFVGRSRSVTIILAYLMKKRGMSFSKALEHVKSRRPQASPNSGFISQLKELEKSLQEFMRDDKVPCEIEQGLFLGSMGAAGYKDGLKSRNVTHVLTVSNSLSPAHPNDFVYKVVAVADREDTNLSQYFDECIDFIDEAKRQGGGVLVHCFVGRSRSVTIILAYLMKKRGMSFSKALEHVKSRRPQASPNSGFISQLKELEKSLQGGK